MKKEIFEINPYHIEWNEKIGDKSRIIIYGVRPKGEVMHEIHIKFNYTWGKYITRMIRKWLNMEIQEKIDALKEFENYSINDNQ